MSQLTIRDLTVAYPRGDAWLHAVRGIDLELSSGEAVGLVGESGCGKSTVAKAILGLLPDATRVTGSVMLDGLELIDASDDQLRAVRGRRIAMVPQGAMAGLNPVRRVGTQLAETLRVVAGTQRADVGQRSAELFDEVGLDPRLLRRYPHELSGGQRQRVVVALALACGASLLLADEPMTGLDLATQTGLLRLLDRLRDQRNLGMLLVSHDLNALMRHCDRLAVMYAGRVVEAAPTRALATEARHPYSRGLLASVASVDDAADWATVPGTPPDMTEPPHGCAFVNRCPLAQERCHSDDPHPAMLGQSTVACHRGNETTDLGFPAMPPRQTTQGTDPIVEARGLTVVFGSGAGTVVALHRVDLTVARSEVVGLVGESGSGKSTLARVLLGLLPPGEGTVRIDGTDLDHATRDVIRGLRRRIGFVHQDPYGSLHPGMTVADLVAEPLVIARVPKDEHPGLVAAALASAGLEPTETLNRYPGRLSGGQRQRVAIARAIVGDPVLLVCDEATAMLDVSTRAGVARTIRQLADERGVATVFVTHDLGEAAHVCDRILVLRAGEVVDSGPTRSVLASPTSHYTRDLFHHARRGG